MIVIVGGATRLTDSGLSITEWHPVTGIFPPLTEASWLAELEKYRGTTEYELINKGFGLADFKVIYFWEWGHRLLGRVVGLVFLGGLAWFAFRKRLTSKQAFGLLGICALVGLQGAVGWWMVKSGLVGRVDVAPYRLATHLTLACLILMLTVWTATGFAQRSGILAYSESRSVKRFRFAAIALVALVLSQIFFGALVAGNKAGLVYNTWPLMDGQLIPGAGDLFFTNPVWRNFFENHLLVQFNHRMMAYALVALAFWHAFDMRRATVPYSDKMWAGSLAILMLGQALLGILTLLLVAPLWAALAHQAYAAIVLIVATIHARRLMQPADLAESASYVAARA